jgi:hypothetical protein
MERTPISCKVICLIVHYIHVCIRGMYISFFYSFEFQYADLYRSAWGAFLGDRAKLDTT